MPDEVRHAIDPLFDRVRRNLPRRLRRDFLATDRAYDLACRALVQGLKTGRVAPWIELELRRLEAQLDLYAQVAGQRAAVTVA